MRDHAEDAVVHQPRHFLTRLVHYTHGTEGVLPAPRPFTHTVAQAYLFPEVNRRRYGRFWRCRTSGFGQVDYTEATVCVVNGWNLCGRPASRVGECEKERRNPCAEYRCACKGAATSMPFVYTVDSRSFLSVARRYPDGNRTPASPGWCIANDGADGAPPSAPPLPPTPGAPAPAGAPAGR